MQKQTAQIIAFIQRVLISLLKLLGFYPQKEWLEPPFKLACPYNHGTINSTTAKFEGLNLAFKLDFHPQTERLELPLVSWYNKQHHRKINC